MIQTAPAARGITFSLDGKRFTTDRHGLALIRVTHPGSYRLSVVDDDISNSHEGRVFVAWSDGRTASRRNIEIKTFTWMRAAYEVRYKVRPVFTDQAGNHVPATRTDAVMLRADDGKKITLTGGGPYWIAGERAGSRADSDYSKTIFYIVTAVVLDGEELNLAGPNAWVPAEGRRWTISLPRAVDVPAAEPAVHEQPAIVDHPPWLPWVVVAGAAMLAAVAGEIGRKRRRSRATGGRHAIAIPPAPPQDPELETGGRDELTELHDALRDVERLTERIELERRSLT